MDRCSIRRAGRSHRAEVQRGLWLACVCTPMTARAEGWDRMPELLAWAVGAALLILLLLAAVVRMIDRGTEKTVSNPWLRPLLRNTLMFGAVAATVYLIRGGELPAHMTIGVAAIVIVLKTLTDMLGEVGTARPVRPGRARRGDSEGGPPRP